MAGHDPALAIGKRTSEIRTWEGVIAKAMESGTEDVNTYQYLLWEWHDNYRQHEEDDLLKLKIGLSLPYKQLFIADC
ncbi:hypothetical protein K2173_021104 [Erythroxylum novogranatense]|uniref:Uncharacterized protein n=1 Tax=Erythroxylum novogranatense TaxID=1862640 RepID=A0AAV8TQH9_9ROSI|nr:hypothetical protein K2173_021104 [Erythroxylum novogranatense]